MMPAPTRVLLLILLAVVCPGGAARGAATVTIDPAARHQTILGWGATASPLEVSETLRDQILDTAVNELGLTRLRWEPPRREWEDVLNDDGDPYHVEWRAFTAPSADQKARNCVLPFKQRVEANGDPFNLYISPSFFDGGSTGSAPAWLLHSPAEYAEWVVAYLTYLKQRHGVVPDYYCICNEAGNNNAFSPSVVGAMIRALGPALKASGFPTRIQFPEGVNARTSWRYIEALRDDAEVWPHVGLLTYHLYGDGSPRPDIRDFARARGIPTGQTEYMGTTVDHLYDDLTLGGVSYWEHYGLAGPWGGNGTYYHTEFSGGGFRRYAHYWHFRQVMRYVRPGAVRVEATSDDAAVRPLAFLRDGKMTLVLLNNKPGQQTRPVTLRGLPAGDYGVCAAVGQRPYQETGVRPVAADGSLSLDVPAGAVLTLYPYPGANQPPVPTEWQAAPPYLTAPAGRVTLSALATDAEGDPLTFAWRVVSAPPEARVALAAPNAAQTAANGLTQPGEYVFEVAVKDGAHTTARRLMVPVFAENQPPRLLDLHNRIPVTVTLPNSRTNLRGGAMDVEKDPVAVRWSVVNQPPGAGAVLETPDKGACLASGLTVAGDYLFRLEARDPTHVVTKDLKVTVYPANTPPTIAEAKADPAQLPPAGGSVALSCRSSDADGDVVTHWWSAKRAPAGARPVLARPGAPSTRADGLTQEGTYVFTVAAIDRTLVTTRDVTVIVGRPSPAPAPVRANPLPYPAGSQGATVGTVTATGAAWVDLKGEDGRTLRYIPEWSGGMPTDGGGPDKAMTARIARLKPGDRVRLQWKVDHNLRVLSIEPE